MEKFKVTLKERQTAVKYDELYLHLFHLKAFGKTEFYWALFSSSWIRKIEVEQF